MTLDLLKDYINTGREIEFEFKSKKYSITYYNDSRKNYISFCEFYNTPVDVSTFEDLIKIKIENESLAEIWSNLNENEIDVF